MVRPEENVIIGCCNVIAGDGGYLLVREAKASARGRYNLPAGKPLVGETLVDAAIRETKEETGLDIAVDSIVGLYHCPQTSEGFGVLNVVFASTHVGGELTTSDAHPDVRFFPRGEIRDLAANRLVRGTHIERAIDAFGAGMRWPLTMIDTVEPSALPAGNVNPSE